jgi:hypothetical protein
MFATRSVLIYHDLCARYLHRSLKPCAPVARLLYLLSRPCAPVAPASPVSPFKPCAGGRVSCITFQALCAGGARVSCITFRAFAPVAPMSLYHLSNLDAGSAASPDITFRSLCTSGARLCITFRSFRYLNCSGHGRCRSDCRVVEK